MMQLTEETSEIRVLLVEDNPADAAFVRHQLIGYQGRQYHIELVNRLETAVEVLSERPFGVILLDLHLPDAQGMETFVTLNEVVPHLPVIVLTGQSDHDQAVKLVKLGAQDYLLKDELNAGLLSRAIRYAIARKDIEKELDDAAHYDALTGLPNRALFHDRLDQAIARSRRRDTVLHLMFMDLDHFKEVNDTLGHAAGDELLRQLGERFDGITRSSDTVARMGGDEFTMIVEDAESDEALLNIANKLLHLFDEPFAVAGTEVTVGTSIGIATCSNGALSADSLLSRADEAMYRAKECGGNCYWIYPESAPDPANEVKGNEGMEDGDDDAKWRFAEVEWGLHSDSADVMLVDDNPGDRRLMTEAFREARLRHRLRVVSDAGKVLECLRRRGPKVGYALPRLILLDINMPGTSGFDMLGEIRELPGLSGIPVVIFSTSNDPQDVQRAYELGADAYVKKPSGFSHTVRVVDTLVRYWLDTVKMPASRAVQGD